MTAVGDKPVPWRLGAVHVLLGYATLGLLISVTQNVVGLFTGNLSAFVWTGSIKDNVILMFWWVLVPALTWPLDLWWTVYYKVLN